MGLFGLGNLPLDKKRALTIVMAASVGLTMGVNFIQPVLPALIKPFGISDSALGLVMTALTGPAIFLSPIFGVVADLHGRRLLLGVTQMAQWSLTDLADFLAASPALNVSRALNLDGGASSGLWMGGSFSGVSMNSFEPVPSVIAVTAR